MTAPLGRAAKAVIRANHPRLKPSASEMDTPIGRSAQRAARAAYEAIDTNELRDEIAGWPIGSGYYGTQIGTDEARDIALAVKNWLTGKDTQ